MLSVIIFVLVVLNICCIMFVVGVVLVARLLCLSVVR